MQIEDMKCSYMLLCLVLPIFDFLGFLGTWFLSTQENAVITNGHVDTVVAALPPHLLGGNNRSTDTLSSAYPRLPPFVFLGSSRAMALG